MLKICHKLQLCRVELERLRTGNSTGPEARDPSGAIFHQRPHKSHTLSLSKKVCTRVKKESVEKRKCVPPVVSSLLKYTVMKSEQRGDNNNYHTYITAPWEGAVPLIHTKGIPSIR